jgi:hypothetical protein
MHVKLPFSPLSRGSMEMVWAIETLVFVFNEAQHRSSGHCNVSGAYWSMLILQYTTRNE